MPIELDARGYVTPYRPVTATMEELHKLIRIELSAFHN